MRDGRKHTRALGALAAAGVLALTAAAPSATAAPSRRAAIATGISTFLFTQDDTATIDYTEAIQPPGRIPITGDFVGPDTAAGSLDDIFWYTPGAGGDAIWQTKGDRSWASTATSVGGTFTPLVGSFTSDGKQDIFWYAPGAAADSLWDFNPDGSITKTTINVNGSFTPIVGRFSDDAGEDIIWYAPGPAADAWWDFDGLGGRTNRPFDIKGTFTPVVGSFAGSGSPTFDYVQDIIWYAPGTAADSLWDFNDDGGAIVKTPLAINGTFTPVAGDFTHDGFNDVIWYVPGRGQDYLWNFTNATGGKTSTPLTINGTYTPIAATDVFANGPHQTDIVWFGAGSRPDALWDFDYGPDYASRPITLDGNQKPVLAVLEGGTSSGTDIIDRTL
jgi:hypothetical protein